MKRSTKTKQQPKKLLVSTERVRRLHADDLREVAGGALPDPCAHSNGVPQTSY